MNFEDIIGDLKAKKYSPVYFLMGEEAYFIDRIADFIAGNVLNEQEKTFNQIVLYGKDTDARTVVETARRFPMMAPHFILIVREAQHLKPIDELIHYVEHPLGSTILVICYKYRKLDKRTRLYRAIAGKGLVFDSRKLYEDKLPAWISAYAAQRKRQIRPEASVVLAGNTGNDLGRIAGELDKLMIALPDGKEITVEDIERHTGISKEYNNFELHKALGDRDILKANKIAQHFSGNPKSNPLVLTITSLYYFFSRLLLYHSLKDKGKAAAALKINPYFVRDYQKAAGNYPRSKVEQIISILRDYDARVKGFEGASQPEGELLRELVFKILH